MDLFIYPVQTKVDLDTKADPFFLSINPWVTSLNFEGPATCGSLPPLNEFELAACASRNYRFTGSCLRH